MGKALYRTYRSRKLSEIVGQEHITKALSNAIKKGTLSHAYLFTGPRGVGKTSIARILAHEINGLPYSDDSMHLDIIEIDAASNRRIDEIRDLREKVHIAPTSAKYKVYIIDEVHMLTKEAFNALLKTLEEPPAHVVFILATTESHKLPETIVSRTQRFTFKPIDSDKVVAHLRSIAEHEHIAITDDALQLIAKHGDGSFRDSISLLDQIRNHDHEVTLSDVQTLLGIAPHELIEQLLGAMVRRDPAAVVGRLRDMQTQGYEPAQIAKQLGHQLRGSLLDGTAVLPPHVLLETLASLVNVPASVDPQTTLEITLLDVALGGANPVSPEALPTTADTSSSSRPTAENDAHAAHRPEEKQAEAHPDERSDLSAEAPLDQAVWPQVLAAIKGHHNTLYGIARAAQPHFKSGGLTLELEHAFHRKQLAQKRNLVIITEAIRALTGQTITVQCVLRNDQPPLPAPPVDPDLPMHSMQQTEAKANQEDTALSNISNIFGGAELLES